jgi:glycosyltransferase involved in cell wall biosynthesis
VLVSVIIPIYNSGMSLSRTMTSILAQTYEHLQIILIDDGSTDDSFLIASQYASERVLVLRQKNSGAAVARNKGLEFAKGYFIQFLDAGDVLSFNKIELQVLSLKNDSDKVAVCNYKQFTNDEDMVNVNYPDQSSFIFSCNNPQEFLIRLWGGYGEMNFIQTNCWLVPRHLIHKVGGWRSYRCPDDDGEFFARVLLASNGVIYVPDIYNYYHIHPKGYNQLSRNRNLKYIKNTLLTIDLKHQYLLGKGTHPYINKAIAAQYYRFALDIYPINKVLSSIAYNRFKSFREMPPKIVLGGRLFQLFYKIFGWRLTRLLRYLLRKA